MFERDKLDLVAILGEGGEKLRITTTDNIVYEGYLESIDPQLDEDNEELDFDCAVFKADGERWFLRLNNWDIKSVEQI